MRYRHLIPAAFLFISFLVAASPAQNDLAQYIKENYTKREVSIPMRDGVKLFTVIYEPRDRSVTYPILLNRTPYSVGPYGSADFATHLGPSDLYARAGYIFANQDVRGRFMSEGDFEHVRPDIPNTKPSEIDESTDAYDTIDWLLRNVANNNGKVGTYGISYPGFYTSAGSIDSHPALKACSPQAPVGDWFRGDDIHHNGALFLAQNYYFFGVMGQRRPGLTDSWGYLRPWVPAGSSGAGNAYDYFLGLGGLKEVADTFQRGLGHRVEFWDEMMAHPNYDDWWKERSILAKLRYIRCATMTVGGWYDNEDLYGALKTYQHIELQNPGIFNVLVVGPWDHGGWSHRDGDWLGTAYFGEKTGEQYRKMELAFFDHFLKGRGDISGIKEVNFFDTGAHRWIELSSSRPGEVKDMTLYLTTGGRLSNKATAGTTGTVYDEYVSDPWNPVPYTQKILRPQEPNFLSYPRDFMTEDQRFASTRPDVLVFQTEPLEEDITVTGEIKPTLFVSSSGTDSDFVVKLIDVFPDDYRYPSTAKTLPSGQPERVKPPEEFASSVFQPGGYQMLLRGEPMPARFRNGFERPEPLRPNVPVKLSFVLPAIAHTFKKGHRIMVQIQSTWFPLVARNPQKFMQNYKLGTAADFQKATQRVYLNKRYASAVTLPVLER